MQHRTSARLKLWPHGAAVMFLLLLVHKTYLIVPVCLVSSSSFGAHT